METRRGRGTPSARRSAALDVFPLEAGGRRAAFARYARTDLVRPRHLEGVADPAARRGSSRCLVAQAERGAPLRWQARARADAVRERRRSLCGPAVSRRAARRLELSGG